MKTIIISFSITTAIIGVAIVNAQEQPHNLERYTEDSIPLTALDLSTQDKQEVIALEQLDYDSKQEIVEEIIEPEPEPEIVEVGIYHTSTLPGLTEFYQTYKEVYSLAPDCHPYLLASIHYRETNFGNTNGWNGQGAFQNIRNHYESNSMVANWQEQAIQACDHLKYSVGWQHLTNLNDYELVGTALARYNGCRGAYYQNCSYVVNKTNLMSVGTKCAVDGCAYTTTDNRYGALSIVSQLKELNI